jgi:hypothetical protein
MGTATVKFMYFHPENSLSLPLKYILLNIGQKNDRRFSLYLLVKINRKKEAYRMASSL